MSFLQKDGHAGQVAGLDRRFETNRPESLWRQQPLAQGYPLTLGERRICLRHKTAMSSVRGMADGADGVAANSLD